MKLCKHHSLVDDAWFCDLITVRGPGASEEAAFPCYQWVQGQGVLSLPEGTGEGRGGDSGTGIADPPVEWGPAGGQSQGLGKSKCWADAVGRKQGSGATLYSPRVTPR